MTSPTAVLAPNGRWSALTQIGKPAANGFVFTYENQTRVPKATYQDPAEQVLNTNPIRLDAKGEANIYWDINLTYYTIEVYAANPNSPFIPGELIYSQNNYPFVNGSGGGNIIINSLSSNFVRNWQFTFWGSNKYRLPVSDTPEDVYTRLSTNDAICDDFFFERSNTNCTVEISRQNFNIGQTDIPGTPLNYLNYQCTDVGAGGESFKAISQTYQSAQTLSNTEVSIGIYAKSVTSSNLTVYITQFFGTGGSPSNPVITPAISEVLTTDWTQYTAAITIPSVAGKVFGTNGDDYVKISVGLPLNAIANIDVSTLQFNNSNTLPAVPCLSVNDQYKGLDAVVNEGTSVTGDFKITLSDDEQPGWLLCDDATIGSSFSNAAHAANQYLQLYLTIWNKISDIYAPIYDSDGVPTTRGDSAIDDWNDDKQLNLTRVLGRVLGAVGQPTLTMQFTAETSPQTFTADASSDQLTVASTATLPNGQAIAFTTTGSLPSPLLTGTTYFSIPTSSTTLKVATSYANAQAGVAINLTTTGTGVNSVYADDLLTVGDALSFYTGTPFTVENFDGALPDPLVESTTYYAIYVDSAHFKAASSYANAIAGISIPITDSGTGTNIATITYSQSTANGQPLGEFAHGQTEAEISLHGHGYLSMGGPFNFTQPSGSTPSTQINAETGTAGNSQPANVIHPSFYTNCFLKL